MYKEYEKKELDTLKKAELLIVQDFANVCRKHDIEWFAIGGSVIGAVRHNGFIPWDDDFDLGMLREDYNHFLSVWECELGDRYHLATPETDKKYSSPVVKLMRKGTRFVPEYLINSKAELGIHIDIFVYDNYTNDERSKKQIKKARIIDQLLFLRGSGNPNIPLKGMKRLLASGACKFIHFLMVIFQISPKWLYKRLEKESKKYNAEKTEFVTTYQDPYIHDSRLACSEIKPVVYKKFENIEIPIPNEYMRILERYYGDGVMELPPLEKRVNHAPEIIEFGPFSKEIDGLE